MTRFFFAACLSAWISSSPAQDSILDLQSGPLSGKTLVGALAETLGVHITKTQFDDNPGLLVMAGFGGITGPGISGGGTAYWVFNGSQLTEPGNADMVLQQAFRFSAAQGRDRLDAGHQIGDFNGDGEPDFSLRIRPISSRFTATAYVVFGSLPIASVDLATLPSADGLVITSNQASGQGADFTLAESGDFNGDGVSDLLLGMREGQGDATRAGLVFVLLGGGDLVGTIDLDSIPPSRLLTILGAGFEDYIGEEVAFVGDVNQDGFDDILIGSEFADAYLIKGRATLPSSPLRIAALSGTDGTIFSAANPLDTVATAGDFNGDGTPDLAFASTDPDFPFLSSRRDPGAAYVVYGSPNLPASVDLETLSSAQGLKITGYEDGDDVGTTIGGGGDINGDGFDDLLIGAHLAISPGPASFLVFGGASVSGPLALPTLAASRGVSLNPGNGGLEQVPEFAGDLNGDGLDDLAVGDRLGVGNQGAVYVVSGNAAPTGIEPAALNLLPLIAADDMAEGQTLSDLFGAGFFDPVETLSGVAFLPAQTSAVGEWQVQNPGASEWITLDSGQTDDEGVLYEPESRIRFRVSDGQAGTPPALSVRLWDGRGQFEFGTPVNVTRTDGPISPFSQPLSLTTPNSATIFFNGFE